MRPTRNTICEDTLYIIKEYYSHNTEPLFSVLAEDCVWMGVGNLLVSGASAIKACFKDGFIMPHFAVKEAVFRLIETGSEDQLMVLGQYMIFSSKEEAVISAAKQRGTFCWRKAGEYWYLYHMHVSNEWNELIGDEIFPERVSRQTYFYMQKLLAEKNRSLGDKLTLKWNGRTEFVELEKIIYVEAQGKECILYTENESKSVKNSFKEISEMLPPYFFRPHRSYLVNCRYVEKIERYSLRLYNGVCLSIPKAKYLEIKEKITTLIQEQDTAADAGNCPNK